MNALRHDLQHAPPVGSGKTTLLLSLLSETTALSGPAFLPSHPRPSSLSYDPNVLTDSTAYCSQSPWLLNDSIRNNVLFGLVFDEKRYGEVLDACALRVDLKQFGLGDGAEVGERGTVVSGGQKVSCFFHAASQHFFLSPFLSPRLGSASLARSFPSLPLPASRPTYLLPLAGSTPPQSFSSSMTS